LCVLPETHGHMQMKLEDLKNEAENRGLIINVKKTKVLSINTNKTDPFTLRDESTRDADKSLARPTSRCILFDGENISFDASLVIYI